MGGGVVGGIRVSLLLTDLLSALRGGKYKVANCTGVNPGSEA